MQHQTAVYHTTHKLTPPTEGIDVTAKALMHRVTKIRGTQIDAAEPGKASPLKTAKRAVDGKPKAVVADPEEEDGGDADVRPWSDLNRRTCADEEYRWRSLRLRRR